MTLKDTNHYLQKLDDLKLHMAECIQKECLHLDFGTWRAMNNVRGAVQDVANELRYPVKFTATIY